MNTDRECGGQARLRILLDYISEGSVSISMVYGQFLAQTAIISSNYVMPTPTLRGVVSLRVSIKTTGNATTSAFGLALLHGLITSWHPFHNKSILKRGRVVNILYGPKKVYIHRSVQRNGCMVRTTERKQNAYRTAEKRNGFGTVKKRR